MVESTLIIEQPFTFAGGRSVEGLSSPRRSAPPKKGSGSLRVEGSTSPFRVSKFRIARYWNASRQPNGHSSLASDLVVMTKGARRAKEEGIATRLYVGTRELVSSPTPRTMRESATSGRPLQPSLGSSTRRSLHHPKKVGPVFETGSVAGGSHPSHSRRKLVARRKLGEGNLLRGRGSSAHVRVRVSYFYWQLQKSRGRARFKWLSRSLGKTVTEPSF